MAKSKIIFVDDEPNVLSALQRVFRKKDYELHVFTEPDDVFQMLRTQKVSVLVSDQRMPKMNGCDLLRLAKQISPDTSRLILTGYSDIESAMKAINEGSVYRFLTKPWNEDELMAAVEHAVAHYELILENHVLNDLVKKQNDDLQIVNESLEIKIAERIAEVSDLNKQLEKNFFESVKVMGSIYEMGSSESAGHSKRVARMAVEMGKMLHLPSAELFQIQAAGYLHDLGKVGQSVGDVDLLDASDNHHSRGAEMVRRMPNLHWAAKYILHHHEKFDGTGVPLGLREKNIPTASQIIAIADVYDVLMFGERGAIKSTQDSFKRISTMMSGTYFDPDIVNLLKRYLEETGRLDESNPEEQIEFYELNEGMILSRPLLNNKGAQVLEKDLKISNLILDRLQAMKNENALAEEIFVYRKSLQENIRKLH